MPCAFDQTRFVVQTPIREMKDIPAAETTISSLKIGTLKNTSTDSEVSTS